MAGVSEKPVELGFAERRTSWKLRSKFFPSKIGGRPSWLNLKDLPSSSELECLVCKKPCVFLLQVYAPYETEESFHRTLFIFMCKDGNCCKRNKNNSFIIFRNQLPRQNDFYSFDPPVETEKDSNTPSVEQYLSVCDICGCRGELQCSECHNVNYCGLEHQTIDRQAGHKSSCAASSQGNNVKQRRKTKNPFILPEFDLVMDTEDFQLDAPEKSDEEKMQEYYKFMKSAKAPSESDCNVENISAITKKSDKTFNKFQKRVNHEPEQVLRYNRHGEPLWVSSENVPSEKDIPTCRCGAKRLFEFQVMPQLLNYLSIDTNKDSLDWGTLAVYTCANSCSLENDAYVKEFLWKQDYAEDKE